MNARVAAVALLVLAPFAAGSSAPPVEEDGICIASPGSDVVLCRSVLEAAGVLTADELDSFGSQVAGGECTESFDSEEEFAAAYPAYAEAAGSGTRFFTLPASATAACTGNSCGCGGCVVIGNIPLCTLCYRCCAQNLEAHCACSSPQIWKVRCECVDPTPPPPPRVNDLR